MRRLRHNLIFTYKVIFGLVSDSCNGLFTMSNTSISTWGHAYKLFQRHSHLDSRKHFFAERIIKPWNSLPVNNDAFKSLVNFKSFVNSVNLKHFCHLIFKHYHCLCMSGLCFIYIVCICVYVSFVFMLCVLFFMFILVRPMLKWCQLAPSSVLTFHCLYIQLYRLFIFVYVLCVYWLVR